MTQDQVISITDLRLRTKRVIDGATKRAKYIFIHNKPKVVLLPITEYENIKHKMKAMEMRQEIEEAKKSGKIYDNIDDLITDALAD